MILYDNHVVESCDVSSGQSNASEGWNFQSCAETHFHRTSKRIYTNYKLKFRSPIHWNCHLHCNYWFFFLFLLNNSRLLSLLQLVLRHLCAVQCNFCHIQIGQRMRKTNNYYLFTFKSYFCQFFPGLGLMFGPDNQVRWAIYRSNVKPPELLTDSLGPPWFISNIFSI